MTKKIVTATATDIKYDLDGHTIAEALLRLHDLGVEYGFDAKIDIGQECEPYSNSEREYAYARLTVLREETDDEYSRRVALEQCYADARQAADMAAYERIKRARGEA